MNSAAHTEGTLVLDTGLFEDADTVKAALVHLNIPQSSWCKLRPELMNDRDWDKIISQILSAKRVITV